MTATSRILAAIGIAALVLLVAGAGTAVWLAHAYGTLELEVHSSGPTGDDVSVRLPGGLVRIAAALVPREARRESAREIAEWLPVAKAALSELSRCPDAHLVDVRSHGDTVRISKRGDVILAEVTSRRENVRVSIPLRAAGAVLAALAESVDAPGTAVRE